MKSKNILIGAHVSIVGGIHLAPERAKNIRGNIFQIFLQTPLRAAVKTYTDDEISQFRTAVHDQNIKFWVTHCSYLLNFAKNRTENEYAYTNLKSDLAQTEKLGGAGVVLHIGKFLKENRETAKQNFIANIKSILAETSGTIILENTAGQGTEMGHDLDELADIAREIGNTDRIKFCIDTCHAFVAGYDIRDAKTFANLLEKKFGSKIACIHLNDSKVPLGKRVDRHQNFGDGHIGLDPLVQFTRITKEKGWPLIVETPDDGNGQHAADILKITSRI